MKQQTSQELQSLHEYVEITNAHACRCELVPSLFVNPLVCSFETFRKLLALYVYIYIFKLFSPKSESQSVLLFQP